VGVFALPARRREVLLYKGPDAEAEIAEAAAEAAKRRVRLRVVERYELLDALGTRTIVEISA
jgi:16S rRNA (guanine527-N7)-methyltransferase